jgi:hypothetical protein
MNCIFICVFNDKKYVDMFYLLLESILRYGNLDTKTEILVYTSTEFMNMIKHSYLSQIAFDNNEIKFEINDTYDYINTAKLDIFNLSSISNYNKILYLDTCILVKNDINKVFNECQDDILYAIDNKTFSNNVHKIIFTSVLLFNNCHTIKEMFIKISEDIKINERLYNNNILKSFIVINDKNIYSDKIIHQFLGSYEHKIYTMNRFLNSLKTKYFKIPKILFQTNKIKHKEYILTIINNNLSPDWRYEFYDDNQVIQFFIDNPIEDLPDVIQKYNSFKKGAHRADLFRYYYMYINGGFFMDADAMLYVNIDYITKNYDFVSVNSSYCPGTIFQGILGASPKNEIIKLALYHAYNTNQSVLKKDYLYFCRELYNIIKTNHFDYNIKLYVEKKYNISGGIAKVVDNKNNLLFKHYCCRKKIPNSIIGKEDYLNTPILPSILIIILIIILALISVLMTIFSDKNHKKLYDNFLSIKLLSNDLKKI